MISASFPGSTWCSSFWLNSANTWYSLSTKVITSLNAMPVTKKPGRSITFTIVPLPGATTVVCSRFQRAFSSWARVVSTCAWATRICACAVVICALTPATAREVALDPAGQLFPHLLLGGARRGDLRGELVDVGLRLLEVEAVAGAGGGELGVLRHAFPGQFERRLQRGDLVRRLVELFVQLRARPTAASGRRVSTSPSRARSAPTFASSDTSCASSARTSLSYGVGSIRNSTSPFFTGRLFSTGTSITRPLHLRHDRHDVLDDPDVGGRRRDDVQQQSIAARPTTGKIATATFHGVVHGSSLNLMKISQTKNAVDAEQDDFH